jgi:hypothetical protein
MTFNPLGLFIVDVLIIFLVILGCCCKSKEYYYSNNETQENIDYLDLKNIEV